MDTLPEKKIPCFVRFFILLSIPLIFYISLLFAYFGKLSLKTEFHSIIIVGIILIIFIFFIKHNAWYSYCKFKNSFHKIIIDVEQYLNDNELVIHNKKKSFGSIDDFFDDFLANIRNDNFTSVASSIFPTLGILGTFIAIAISMPNFSVESQEALDLEITTLLNGVGTAFYASIFGIFLSIWWIFFEKKGLTKIQKEIDKTKNKYKSRIWNKDEIEILSIIENKTQNMDLIAKLENTINPNFIQNLESIAQSKIELIQELSREHKKLENVILERYEKMINLFDQSASKQENIMKDFEKLHDLMAKINSQSYNSMSEYNTFAKALKTEIYTVLSSFELISSDLRTFGQDLIKYNNKESKNNEEDK